MRIIDTNKDYYDTALSYGRDSDVVFVRNAQVFTDDEFITKFNIESNTKHYWQLKSPFSFNKFRVRPLSNEHNLFLYSSHNCLRYIDSKKSINDCIEVGKTEWLFDPVTVWFAGVKYCGIMFAAGDSKHFVWSYDNFIKILSGFGVEFKTEKTEHKRNHDYFKNEYFVPSDEDKEHCIENSISIMTYGLRDDQFGVRSYSRRNNFGYVVNGSNLKDFQFQKVLDPYQAMQELSMWIGGVLPKDGNPMVEITGPEKVLLAKHGFDKMSFKKEKEAKKAS